MAGAIVLQNSENTTNYYTNAVQLDTNSQYHNNAAGVHRTHLQHISHSTTMYWTVRKGDPRKIHEIAQVLKYKHIFQLPYQALLCT